MKKGTEGEITWQEIKSGSIFSMMGDEFGEVKKQGFTVLMRFSYHINDILGIANYDMI